MAAELFEAINKDDRVTVGRLLEADAGLASATDANGVSAVLTAVYRGRSAITAALVARKPALDVFEASATGDTERVGALIDQDASAVNAIAPDGFHPLGLAAFFRHPDVVRLLIERGASVAAPARNKLAVTALHSALATDVAPVHMAIVRMLLEAGAPVNVPHLGGGTPLHTAAFVGDPEVVRMLLDRGADPLMTTDDGKTAIDIARERGHAALAEMLERKPLRS